MIAITENRGHHLRRALHAVVRLLRKEKAAYMRGQALLAYGEAANLMALGVLSSLLIGASRQTTRADTHMVAPTMNSSADGGNDRNKCHRGADWHWRSLVSAECADGRCYRGWFTQWDPHSCELTARQSISTQNRIVEIDKEAVIWQDSKIYRPDGTVMERGPQYITRAHSSSKGVYHPIESSPWCTSIAGAHPNRPSAWIKHSLFDASAADGQGAVQRTLLGFSLKPDEVGTRFCVAYVFDEENKLKYVTYNREDARTWPSNYWSAEDNNMTKVVLPSDDYEAIEVELGLRTGCQAARSTKFPKACRGHGIRLAISPEVSQENLSLVDWEGHLASLRQGNVLVRSLSGGLIMIVPAELERGKRMSAGFLWKEAVADGDNCDEPSATIIHSVELRYLPSGEFECMRYLRFDVE